MEDIATSVRAEFETPQEDSVVRVSVREQAILEFLAKGASNKVIARELEIAEATVKTHVKSLLHKLRVRNRTQAAMWWIVRSQPHSSSRDQNGLPPQPGTAKIGLLPQTREIAKKEIVLSETPDEIIVSLTAAERQIVLNLLGRGIYERVAPIIQKISEAKPVPQLEPVSAAVTPLRPESWPAQHPG